MRRKKAIGALMPVALVTLQVLTLNSMLSSILMGQDSTVVDLPAMTLPTKIKSVAIEKNKPVSTAGVYPW